MTKITSIASAIAASFILLTSYVAQAVLPMLQYKSEDIVVTVADKGKSTLPIYKSACGKRLKLATANMPAILTGKTLVKNKDCGKVEVGETWYEANVVGFPEVESGTLTLWLPAKSLDNIGALKKSKNMGYGVRVINGGVLNVYSSPQLTGKPIAYANNGDNVQYQASYKQFNKIGKIFYPTKIIYKGKVGYVNGGELVAFFKP
jgi:hypothetical protein